MDRDTFRQGLLTDLADTVHFGRTLAGYQITGSGRVRVRFAEGGSDEGDLLVGADGVGSAVRRQLLPHATVRDVGLRCVYGRMTIAETTDALIPEDFNRGFCWVADENGYGAGFATVRFRSRPEGAPDYLMTTLVATSERLGVPDEKLFRLPSEDLWQIAVEATTDWHPALRKLLAHADTGHVLPDHDPRQRARRARGTPARSRCSATPSTPCHRPAASAPTPPYRTPRRCPANCFPPHAAKSHFPRRSPHTSGSCCRAASTPSRNRSRWLTRCSPKPAIGAARLCLADLNGANAAIPHLRCAASFYVPDSLIQSARSS